MGLNTRRWKKVRIFRLIVKDPEKVNECKQIFAGTINITVEGKRHLGAVIGSEEFKDIYINEKINKWVSNIQKLSEIAQSQPHAAYAAYIHGEQHKYNYFTRTIANISDNLQPLDDVINNTFIPALFGDEISDNERDIISLPVKLGGLGIRKVGNNSNHAYETSQKITKPLCKQIHVQSEELPNVTEVKNAKTKAVDTHKAREKVIHDSIIEVQNPRMKRTLGQLSEQGASSWLGALPIESLGLNLNKGEFQDALAIRYNRTIKNLPSNCPCGASFTVTHALNCHLGGFVNARHDIIRDEECKLLKAVCNDVQSEPLLQPVINRHGYKKTAKLEDDVRLDAKARGFWRDGQVAYFDVCVTNADCMSQQNASVKSILRGHEMRKKLYYNRRIMEIEHGSFTPLIFTTTGVMGHECSIFHKTLAQKLSKKRNERYEDAVRYLRVRFSFLALKSTLLCLRGSRAVFRDSELDTDFGLALNEMGL